MRKIFFAIIVVLWAAQTWAACTGSSPNWSSTPDYASVSSCNSQAEDGDTINVTAGDGEVTWSSQLNVTKGIKIIGPGADDLKITGAATPYTYIISYIPANYQISNSVFEVSGFTFDAAGGHTIRLGSCPNAPFVRQYVNVHHNVFLNSGSDGKGQSIWNYGSLYGVVHNNVFNTNYPIANSGAGGAPNMDSWWANSPQNIYNPGDGNFLFYEDNTFTLYGYQDGADMGMMDGEYGARYVVRYNTVYVRAHSYAMFDLHAMGADYMSPCFGAEVYGNLFHAGNYYVRLIAQRAGVTRVFYNNVDTTYGSVNYAYSTNIPGNPGGTDICPDTYAALKVTHDSYWWGSRRGSTGALLGASVSGTLNCNGLTNIPILGRDVFADESSPGITCGTLAARPATCTVNQGYWATNQSCSNLSGLVGASPSSKIEGTLYKCTSPNTWTVHYTPYTYPHPLRGEGSEDPEDPEPEPTGSILPWVITGG